VLPGAPQRLLIALVATVATIGAIAIDLVQYETFLILLGSFFVPLFGVLLADWLLTGRYEEKDIFAAPPFRPGLLAAWLAGFAFYQWLHPIGPEWWTDLLAETNPPGLGIGATLPSFALAFAVAGAVGYVSRRLRTAAAAT
jgi:NCS1 family nucleobase:cation symporter-1